MMEAKRTLPPNIEEAYLEMAKDAVREAEALEWAEGTLEHFDPAPRQSPQKKIGRPGAADFPQS
ncbi:MAG: hypothetical protein MUC42_01325 [Bryobacter sp.]|jgi:hypothetical protein|nr:hypothetical protein [Bryobacter sp.]